MNMLSVRGLRICRWVFDIENGEKLVRNVDLEFWREVWFENGDFGFCFWYICDYLMRLERVCGELCGSGFRRVKEVAVCKEEERGK